MEPIRVLAAVCLTCALAACGGGGGGGGGPAPAPNGGTLSGTVAIGAPLADVTVEVLAPNGLGTAAGVTTTTDANGNYSVILPFGSRPPYMVRAFNFVQSANPVYPRLFSLATRSGTTVNVTPLTDLLVSKLLDKKQEFFTDLITLNNMGVPTDAQMAGLTQQVTAYLQTRPDKTNGNITAPVSVAGVADFISTPFAPRAGDPYDDALTRLGQSLMDGETITGIEEHMLSGGDPAANLANFFPLDFAASCTATGAPSVPLPSGATSIQLNTAGVNIGSYSHAFQTGNAIFLSTGTVLDNRFNFILSTPGHSVQLVISHGNLESLTLAVPSGESKCTPTATVSLAGKWPSVRALARWLGNSVTAPGFNCASSSFPGISAGANTLLFEQNGALRVNNSAGHALHLPSLDFNVNAEVSGAGFQTVLKSMSASWAFGGNFDTFVISLTAGSINSIQFGKKRGSVTQSIGC